MTGVRFWFDPVSPFARMTSRWVRAVARQRSYDVESGAPDGPVINCLPSDEDALELWDHVVGLARFAGFAELKRSLREQPQLPALGVGEDEAGVQEDWRGGNRRQHR